MATLYPEHEDQSHEVLASWVLGSSQEDKVPPMASDSPAVWT
jgi:hypothetical protein